ncbi:MAG TPA: hypothetical protein DHW02_03100 [Ktedonobacter sp.]|nr:hypothetical protein [Ktedonobacter sp.]
MEIQAFLELDLSFIIVIYLGFLLFMRAPRTVVLPSLLGGLLLAVVNIVTDIVAYFIHFWHYTISGLTFHVPLPFYISDVLFYGSIIYLLIWRFWESRLRWLSLLLLIGTPIFGIVRDFYAGTLAYSPYTPEWQNPFAIVLDIAMWIVMFYGGYLLFRRLSPTYTEVKEQEQENEEEETPQVEHEVRP